MDIKSVFVEWCTKNYVTPSVNCWPKGPGHSMRFTTRVAVSGDCYSDVVGEGEGPSKKASEKLACEDFLRKIGVMKEKKILVNPQNASAIDHQLQREAPTTKGVHPDSTTKDYEDVAIISFNFKNKNIKNPVINMDLKSFLHHWCIKNGLSPQFSFEVEGPGHRKTFNCTLIIMRISDCAVYTMAEGRGSTKKIAAQCASRELVLSLLEQHILSADEVPALDMDAASYAAMLEEEPSPECSPLISAEESNPPLLDGNNQQGRIDTFRFQPSSFWSSSQTTQYSRFGDSSNTPTITRGRGRLTGHGETPTSSLSRPLESRPAQGQGEAASYDSPSSSHAIGYSSNTSPRTRGRGLLSARGGMTRGSLSRPQDSEPATYQSDYFGYSSNTTPRSTSTVMSEMLASSISNLNLSQPAQSQREAIGYSSNSSPRTMGRGLLSSRGGMSRCSLSRLQDSEPAKYQSEDIGYSSNTPHRTRGGLTFAAQTGTPPSGLRRPHDSEPVIYQSEDETLMVSSLDYNKTSHNTSPRSMERDLYAAHREMTPRNVTRSLNSEAARSQSDVPVPIGSNPFSQSIHRRNTFSPRTAGRGLFAASSEVPVSNRPCAYLSDANQSKGDEILRSAPSSSTQEKNLSNSPNTPSLRRPTSGVEVKKSPVRPLSPQSLLNKSIAFSPSAFSNPTSGSESKMEKNNIKINKIGNWTVDVAKSKLHAFLQENKIKTDYKYSLKTGPGSDAFRATMRFHVAQVSTTFSCCGTGSSKQQATKLCAFKLVKQLYRHDLIEPYTGTLKKEKELAKLVEPYKVTLTPNAVQQLRGVCTELKITPATIDPSSRNPINLLLPDVSHHNARVEGQGVVIPTWSKSKFNWDPWTSTVITDGPYANHSLQMISERMRGSYSRKMQTEKFKQIISERNKLPIAAKKDEIVQCVKENSVTIIEGSTGCGKTTQVCQYILDDYIMSGHGAECNIMVTQPRRICSTLIADRVAHERFDDMGNSVGFSVRFDYCLPQPYGGILFCTTGIFLRKLESGLSGITHIIIDEVHERNLNTDYILIILKEMVKVYPDLRVILMSATLNTNLFSRYFDDCPVIHIEGQLFEVEELFLEDCIELLKFVPTPKRKKKNKGHKSIDAQKEEFDKSFRNYEDCGDNDDDDDDVDDNDDGDHDDDDDADDEDSSVHDENELVEENMNRVLINPESYSAETLESMARIDEEEVPLELIEAIIVHFREQQIMGTILIFLAGWNIIYSVMRRLQESTLLAKSAYKIVPLHARLSRSEQKKVFAPVPHGITKIILSTNVAESSVTLSDIVCVIDSCKTRIAKTHNNLAYRYITMWASKSNLEQRKGRAGRVMKGYCFHLCSRARYERLDNNMMPEIFRAPLHEVGLSIKLLRLGNISEILQRAIQPPTIQAIMEAEEMLKELKCLDENNELTPLGSILATLPLDPRLGRMIMVSSLFGCTEEIVKIAAFASLQEDLFFSERLISDHQRGLSKSRFSDHVILLHMYHEWEPLRNYFDSAFRFCRSIGVSYDILDETAKVKNQLSDILTNVGVPLPCMRRRRLDYEWDRELDTVTALLCKGLYPNICYYFKKRQVLLAESKQGIMMKSSVAHQRFKQHRVLSPFFIFGESTERRVITCKQLTMVSPVHLLLFGCQKVEFYNGIIRLDDWLYLDMDPQVAAGVVALRPALEDLLRKVCCDRGYLKKFTQGENKLISVVKLLCKMNLTNNNMNNARTFRQ